MGYLIDVSAGGSQSTAIELIELMRCAKNALAVSLEATGSRGWCAGSALSPSGLDAGGIN